MKDFEMIKTLIQTRLTKAVVEEHARLNEYNAKAHLLRAPILNSISDHYSENPDVKHPFGKSLNPRTRMNITVQVIIGDLEVQIQIAYSDNDGAGNVCNFNGTKRVKLSGKFAAELKKFPLLAAKPVDIMSIATEKAAEIVLSGGDTMKEIDKALEGAVPLTTIPKI